MQFEPIYTAPRSEAARALRRRLALVERQDALAQAQQRQDVLISRRTADYAAPAEKARYAGDQALVSGVVRTASSVMPPITSTAKSAVSR